MNGALAKNLEEIAEHDVRELLQKDSEYGSSWCRRGGTGAFHQALGRKWDRIEAQVAKHGYDLFAALAADPRPEGLIDDIGDLGRYCMLIRAYILSKGHDFPSKPTGQKHPFGYDGEDGA